MKNLHHALILAPAFALAGVACGGNGLSGSTDRASTIATIHGRLENPAGLPLDGSAFRVAIVWALLGPDSRNGILRTSEDVPVTPQFPSQFELNLTRLPPPEAMDHTSFAGIAAAVGAIVAYEDTNYNGRLDLVDPYATSGIDRVLSVPADTTLMYIEGDPSMLPDAPDDVGARPILGFQLGVIEPLGQWACTGGPITFGVTPPSCPGILWKPITTPLTLSVSTSPTLSTYMCGAAPAGTFSDLEQTPGVLADFNGHLPAKNDPQLRCQADGNVFFYGTCAAEAGGSLCQLNFKCTLKVYTFDDSVAADWPCPRK